LGYFIDGIVTVSDILSALGDLEQTSKKVIDVLSHCLVRTFTSPCTAVGKPFSLLSFSMMNFQ